MIEDRSLSPAARGCLDRAYTSSQKGGTLIAEDVQDLEAHERRLQTPDAFRTRYNEERPHWALVPAGGGDPLVPAEVYAKPHPPL